LSYHPYKIQITQHLNNQHIIWYLYSHAHFFGNFAQWCTCVTFVHNV
jgi:hypothetical protein